jgi:hypothetical protein
MNFNQWHYEAIYATTTMEPLAAFLMIADFALAVIFVVLFHWLYRTG